jgi:hypothetical protein
MYAPRTPTPTRIAIVLSIPGDFGDASWGACRDGTSRGACRGAPGGIRGIRDGLVMLVPVMMLLPLPVLAPLILPPRILARGRELALVTSLVVPVPPVVLMLPMGTTCRQEARVRQTPVGQPITNSESDSGDRAANRPLLLCRRQRHLSTPNRPVR